MFRLWMFLVTSRNTAYVFSLALLVGTLAQVKVETYRLSSWRLVVRSVKLGWHWKSLGATFVFVTSPPPFSFSLLVVGSITMFFILLLQGLLHCGLGQREHVVGDSHTVVQSVKSLIQRQSACCIRFETTRDRRRNDCRSARRSWG